ncbi:MAG: TerB family tellurite resistance protein [Cyclobacteriaceae bacterium]
MSALAQLKLLVKLALIDEEVTDREREYVTNIGKANGLSPQDVAYMFNNPEEVSVPTDLSNDQKFDYLFSLVQLMKIDERLYRDEIKYCGNVAAKLGYGKEVMVDLMLKVSATMKNAEMESLREVVNEHLVSK